MSKSKKCDNRATNINRIFYPRCYNNNAVNEVTIHYDKLSNEEDQLILCKECTINLQKDAKKYNYMVRVKKLNY